MDFDTAKLMYEMWIDAEKALATSKHYTLANGQSLTRADLSDVREAQRHWKKQMDILSPTATKRKGIQMKTIKFNYVD